MKPYLLLIPALLAGGCLTGPERVARTEVDMNFGTNKIRLRTPKEYQIKKLALTPTNGLVIEGLISTVNANAVAAQTQQFEMTNELMKQNAAMLQQFGNLAAQYFSGGIVRQQGAPMAVTYTNGMWVPVQPK